MLQLYQTILNRFNRSCKKVLSENFIIYLANISLTFFTTKNKKMKGKKQRYFSIKKKKNRINKCENNL